MTRGFKMCFVAAIMLTLAAASGGFAVVLIKDTGFDVGLCQAAEAGDVAKIRAAIAQDKRRVNALQEDTNRTYLMCAAIKGRTQVVRVLLERGARVGIKASTGRTALMLAVTSGHRETAQLLLDHKAKINDEDHNDYTVLSLAAMGSDVEMARLLLDRGANVNMRGTKYKGTALMQATQGWLKSGAQNADGRKYEGSAEIVELLLARGADVNLADADGGTALMCAASSGLTQIVRLLLARGADVSAKHKSGKTALQWAEAAKYEDIVELLRRAGTKS